MKKRAWKTRIRNACTSVGTYKPEFDYVIDELAGILERRDQAAADYAEDPQPVVSYTNKGGSENMIKNPLLALIDDMNKSALSYWRDLGLTPAGLRKINERTFREKDAEQGNSLLERLRQMKESRGAADG